MRIINELPSFILEVASIVPPCASTILLQFCKPKPLPPLFVDVCPAENKLFRTLFGMPGPLSEIVISINFPDSIMEISIRSFVTIIASNAFFTRFQMTL